MLARFFPQSFVKSNFLSFHLIELTSDCLEAEEEAVGSLFLVHTRSKMLELSFPSKNLKRKKTFNLMKVFNSLFKEWFKMQQFMLEDFLWVAVLWSAELAEVLGSIPDAFKKCLTKIAILENVFGVAALRNILDKIK